MGNKSRAIAITVVLLLAIAGILYAFQGSLYGAMKAYHLLPEPERFTELYFTNPSKLPKATVAGQPITFSFTVHNLEGVTTTYPYSVYLTDANGNKTELADGTITLDPEASKDTTVTHTFATSNLKGSIVVDLTNLNQQIDFLL